LRNAAAFVDIVFASFAVTSATGWTWKPVFFLAQTWLRWLAR